MNGYVEGAGDPTIVSGYRALQRELRKAPAVDFYVADSYDPTKIVKEVAYEGDLRIETTYRDETRKALVSVARYRGAALDGDLEEYDGNGQLFTITPYKNGLKEGVGRSYSDTGAPVGQVRYLQGKKHGTALRYDESGELTAFTEWLDDRQHGKEIRFYDDDAYRYFSPYRYFNWQNGEKEGLCINYQDHGERVAGDSAEYRAGVAVRQISALSPTSQLPEEFRPTALQDFRERHRRAPNGKAQ